MAPENADGRAIDLKNLSQEDMEGLLDRWGEKPFHGRQLFSWLYRPGITSFAQMTDLSKSIRARLAEEATISTLTPERMERSEDGTVKFGFRLADGPVIESVLIPEENRHTLCVSSQAGCAMGCAFCRTGGMGFTRNLTTAEIIGQICAARDFSAQTGGRVSNLVFMGMGEPLANYKNLLQALLILTNQRGLDFSCRRVTVSTCGIVPKIHALGHDIGVNLAVSLHAANDALRSRLMPVNRKWPVEELLAACRDYHIPRRKRIMFEYVLLAGVNDTDDDARQLAARLRKIPCKINLLPYNDVPGSGFSRPAPERIEGFQHILWQAGYTVLLRESRGKDIAAACGQLAGGM